MLIVAFYKFSLLWKKYCASVGFYDNAENIGRCITGEGTPCYKRCLGNQHALLQCIDPLMAIIHIIELSCYK